MEQHYLYTITVDIKAVDIRAEGKDKVGTLRQVTTSAHHVR